MEQEWKLVNPTESLGSFPPLYLTSYLQLAQIPPHLSAPHSHALLPSVDAPALPFFLIHFPSNGPWIFPGFLTRSPWGRDYWSTGMLEERRERNPYLGLTTQLTDCVTLRDFIVLISAVILANNCACWILLSVNSIILTFLRELWNSGAGSLETTFPRLPCHQASVRFCQEEALCRRCLRWKGRYNFLKPLCGPSAAFSRQQVGSSPWAFHILPPALRSAAASQGILHFHMSWNKAILPDLFLLAGKGCTSP